MAVDRDQVQPSVVVRVEECSAPSHEAWFQPESVVDRFVVEVPVSSVGVQRGTLVREAGVEDFVTAVPVEVPCRDPHSGQCLYLFIEGSSHSASPRQRRSRHPS